MEIWQLLVLGGVGLVAGWINVVAGGGSLLTLPVMLFFGLPGPVANGTNRVGILLQSTAASSTFFRRGYADWRLGMSLALAALPGALVGAFFGTRLSGEWFDRFLALTMLVVLILMWRPAPHMNREPVGPGRSRLVVGHLAMLGVGFWGGLIQVGVGFIIMPVLHRVLGLDLVSVNRHKVLIILIYSLVTLIIFAAESQVLWGVGLSLAAGNFVGGWLGAHTSLKHGDIMIRRIFALVVLIFILKLLLG